MKMLSQKKIALVAHDGRKSALLRWAKQHQETLKHHKLFATGTTGELISKSLNLKVVRYLSGPLGGDQQIGTAIAVGKIDMLIFFWDPLEPMPHDPDIKALLRLATMWNIPVACNQATADFLIKSYFINRVYDRLTPDPKRYIKRELPLKV